MLTDFCSDSVCPVCASRDRVPLGAWFRGRGGVPGLVRCRACGQVQRRGVGEDDLHQIESTALWREPSMSPKWLLAWLPRPLRDRQDLAVLDVGCWEGDLLAGMPVHWRRVGVEPNEQAADRGRARGLEIDVGIPEEVSLAPDAFDLVTMMDVLEHLSHPIRTLTAVAGALRPGGLFLALTGSADALSARWWGPRWYYFYYPDHVTVFTERSLRLAVSAAGLRPLTVRRVRHPTSGLGRDMRKAAARLRGVRRHSFHGSVRHIPVGVNVPTATRLLRRADHLLVLAVKP